MSTLPSAFLEYANKEQISLENYDPSNQPKLRYFYALLENNQELKALGAEPVEGLSRLFQLASNTKLHSINLYHFSHYLDGNPCGGGIDIRREK